MVCLQLSDIGRPHTLKEILQTEEPDFWNAAAECVRILVNWQEMTVELFPLYRTNLPKNIELLENEFAQTYLNYVKFRSIYGLADYLWQSINGLCHNLAKELNTYYEDRECKIAKIENIKSDLIHFFEFMEKSESQILEIAQDDLTGFHRLYRHCIWERSNQHLFFVVFSKSCRFIDICDGIQQYGVKAELLWDEVSKSQDPTTPSITGLMETPGDNELVRLY